MNRRAASADLRSDQADFRSSEVCKRALRLLTYRGSALRSDELHLDVGCTLELLAETVGSCLSRTYVGVGGSRDDLTSLGTRGFETHEISLEGAASILADLQEVVGDRRIGSITVLDTIERVGNCDQLLRDIACLARAHSAFVVLSAPNVTHRDIGAKLAFGRWDYTQSGTSGPTSARLFDEKLLALTLERTGLHTIARNDIVESRSDQHFPLDHPALASGTPLHGLLVSSADLADPNSRVSKFIWACAPALEVDGEIVGDSREKSSRPFLTAVIRTQGRRNHTLVEVLNCLAAQSDSDFEIVVVGHRLQPSEAEAVQRVILDCGEWFRSRIRLLQVDDGGRSKPLNVGFENARGRYISIVDDDDIPLGNWIEEFRKLDAKNSGRILRCVSVRQDVVNVETNGKPGVRASGPPEPLYPSEFQLLDHLLDNRSPPIGLAFPRGAFHDLGIRFDESLDTTEDWDYILRVSALCGVASSPTITSIYRWWIVGESSRSDHSKIEWQQNREAILRKQDQQHYILQRGDLAQLRQMVEEVKTLREEARENTRTINTLRVELRGRTQAVNTLRGELRVRAQTLNALREQLGGGTKTVPARFAKLTRSSLNKEIAVLKLKYYLHFFSKNKRRKYRNRIQEYRSFRSQL
jgi:glycosyltransferase involved in cell wall biosynthesis